MKNWIEAAAVDGYETVSAKVMRITPDMAKAMLERNDCNRNIRPFKLRQLVADIEKGQWAFNGEPLIISDDWQLNDGQHRLTAVVQTGVSILSMVVFGVPRETRTTVDQGAARGAADYLGMGGRHHANISASIARTVLSYERSKGLNINSSAGVSNADILDWCDKNAKQIGESAAFASRKRSNTHHYAAPAVIGSCHFILSRIDVKAAETYMEQVTTGENIVSGDPAYAVRNVLLNLGKASRQKKMEVIFRGWVRFRKGDQLKLVKVMGEFPEIK